MPLRTPTTETDCISKLPEGTGRIAPSTDAPQKASVEFDTRAAVNVHKAPAYPQVPRSKGGRSNLRRERLHPRYRHARRRKRSRREAGDYITGVGSGLHYAPVHDVGFELCSGTDKTAPKLSGTGVHGDYAGEPATFFSAAIHARGLSQDRTQCIRRPDKKLRLNQKNSGRQRR